MASRASTSPPSGEHCLRPTAPRALGRRHAATEQSKARGAGATAGQPNARDHRTPRGSNAAGGRVPPSSAPGHPREAWPPRSRPQCSPSASSPASRLGLARPARRPTAPRSHSARLPRWWRVPAAAHRQLLRRAPRQRHRRSQANPLRPRSDEQHQGQSQIGTGPERSRKLLGKLQRIHHERLLGRLLQILERLRRKRKNGAWHADQTACDQARVGDRALRHELQRRAGRPHSRPISGQAARAQGHAAQQLHAQLEQRAWQRDRAALGAEREPRHRTELPHLQRTAAADRQRHHRPRRGRWLRVSGSRQDARRRADRRVADLEGLRARHGSKHAGRLQAAAPTAGTPSAATTRPTPVDTRPQRHEPSTDTPSAHAARRRATRRHDLGDRCAATADDRRHLPPARTGRPRPQPHSRPRRPLPHLSQPLRVLRLAAERRRMRKQRRGSVAATGEPRDARQHAEPQLDRALRLQRRLGRSLRTGLTGRARSPPTLF